MTAGAACTGAAAGEQGVSLQLPVAVGQRRPCRARLSTWFCSRCWRVGSLRLADTAAARTSFQGWPRHQQPRRLCARGLPGVQAQDRPRRARARLCAQRGGELRRCRAPRVRTRTKVQIPPKNITQQGCHFLVTRTPQPHAFSRYAFITATATARTLSLPQLQLGSGRV